MGKFNDQLTYKLIAIWKETGTLRRNTHDHVQALHRCHSKPGWNLSHLSCETPLSTDPPPSSLSYACSTFPSNTPCGIKFHTLIILLVKNLFLNSPLDYCLLSHHGDFFSPPWTLFWLHSGLQICNFTVWLPSITDC